MKEILDFVSLLYKSLNHLFHDPETVITYIDVYNTLVIRLAEYLNICNLGNIFNRILFVLTTTDTNLTINQTVKL